MKHKVIRKKLLDIINQEGNEVEKLRVNKNPNELIEEFNCSIGKNGVDDDKIVEAIEGIIKNSVQTNHPFFMNQMWGRLNEIGVYGDILTTLLNTSMYTYEVAPIMTVLEKECISKLGSFIWSGDAHDGVFTPGASLSNMMAIMLARNTKLQDAKRNGLYGTSRFSIFISDQAHYSFVKGAIFMGFGDESLVKVKSLRNGHVNVDALSEAIYEEKQKGRIPLMIVGIASTTFSGVFDNLEALADIAREHKMWYHIDAAYGGSMMFSRKERFRFKGIDVADSVTWNLHKMMGMPLVCAAFLTKKKGLLNDAFSTQAEYLFHDDNDDFDLGQKSLQCGRKVDALKLWLAWKKAGDAGFEHRVDSLMNKVTLFAEKVNESDHLELLCPPESPIIIFRLYNDGMDDKQLDLLNQSVRDYLFEEGEVIFNYSNYKQKIYLRFVISDPEIKEENIDLIIQKIIDAKELVNVELGSSVA